MKSTWPTRTKPLCIQPELYPTGSHWGSCWVCQALRRFTRLLGYQHVSIGNAKVSRWGYCPTRSPYLKGFALLLTIDFCILTGSTVLDRRISYPTFVSFVPDISILVWWTYAIQEDFGTFLMQQFIYSYSLLYLVLFVYCF